MRRSPTPFTRALALFLCCQPVLWMSNVALAQAVDQATQAQQLEQLRALQGQGGQGQQLPVDLQRLLPQQQGGATQGGAGQGQTGGGLLPAFPPANTPGEPDGIRPERPTLPITSNAPTPVDEPLDPDRYVLGPGDILELHFWGVENFRLRIAVDLEGRAFVPKVGYLDVRGKTLADAQKMLKDSVARYFPRLTFGVNLSEPRTFIVQVVGDVAKAGPQQAKAIDRVFSILTKAGGLGANASKRLIELKRRDGTVLRADLLLYVLTGDVKHNPYVLDGDVIRVPFQSVVVAAGGAVNRPGKYELIETTDVAELVTLAGGLSPAATRGLPITLVRRSADDRLIQTLVPFPSDGQLPDLKLERDDSLWFPVAAELQLSVTVVGAIAGATVTMTGTTPDESSATRRLPFAKGDTVRTVLERVGGVGPLADLRGAYIVRNGEALPVDLYAMVMLRDLSADRPMVLGDTLVVPFQRRNILVEGAVFKPGPYAYNPTFNIEQYLALAGGMNRFAAGMDDVYVVNPSGVMTAYTPEQRVAPGSSIVVPERNFSRSEVVSIILAATGLLLSAATIFITLTR